MVSSLRLAALAIVGCLSLVGCAAEPVTREETPVEDGDTKSPARSTSKDDAADDDDDGDGTLPVTPVTDDGIETTEDRLPPAQGGDEPSKPPKEEPAPTKPTSKTVSCTAPKDGHTSLATVTYTVDEGLVTITKLTMLVQNKGDNDKNDAYLFLKQSGGGEQKVLETNDILANGKTVEVVDAKKITAKAGSTLRIETHFDESFQSDPAGSCTIGF